MGKSENRGAITVREEQGTGGQLDSAGGIFSDGLSLKVKRK